MNLATECAETIGEAMIKSIEYCTARYKMELIYTETKMRDETVLQLDVLKKIAAENGPGLF